MLDAVAVIVIRLPIGTAELVAFTNCCGRLLLQLAVLIVPACRATVRHPCHPETPAGLWTVRRPTLRTPATDTAGYVAPRANDLDVVIGRLHRPYGHDGPGERVGGRTGSVGIDAGRDPQNRLSVGDSAHSDSSGTGLPDPVRP